MRELLALERATTLAEVALWADGDHERQHRTAPWHVVRIPIRPPAGTPRGYDAARDCARGECAIAAIERLAGVLGDRAAPAAERLEALKFLVQLVADIHQPLACADGGEASAGEIHVAFLGRQTTLQALWDRDILVAAGASGNAGAYAAALARHHAAEPRPLAPRHARRLGE